MVNYSVMPSSLQRLDIQGQGLGSEVLCKCFGWTEGKIWQCFGTITCNLTALVKAASHYYSVENHTKVNKNVLGISYYIQQTPRNCCADLTEWFIPVRVELLRWQKSSHHLMLCCDCCRLLLPVHCHRRFHGYQRHTFLTFQTPGRLSWWRSCVIGLHL